MNLVIMNQFCVTNKYKHILIPALGRLRQGDQKFNASLGYRMRTYLKTKQKNENPITTNV
jgi:hypothetical protein